MSFCNFESCFNHIKNNTLLTKDRVHVLYGLAKYAKKLPGHFAELGAYKCGISKMLAMLAPEKQVHVFDTFEGLPQENPDIDGHKQGEFGGFSLHQAKGYFERQNNIVLYPGVFPQCFDWRAAHAKYSLVHVDADLYQSTKAAIHFFWRRLVPGGAIVFDDYENPNCKGVKFAINENLPKENVINMAHWQAVIFKGL